MLPKILFSCVLLCCFGCRPESTSSPLTYTQPTISLSFDDGITQDFPHYPFSNWNARLLNTLDSTGLRATFFVTGSNKGDRLGQELLVGWSEAGHTIANHTWSHPYFHREDLTAEDFARELLRTDTLIRRYPTYQKWFRFPYLKEGNRRGKIDSIRAVLSQHGYRNGHVTIDASDWFFNQELVQFLRRANPDDPQVGRYRQLYLAHLLDRAAFYETLAYEMTGRHIPHTLLMHHNLTSALFLEDVIDTFKTAGWQWIDADRAFRDSFYLHQPTTVPAGESLVYSLAKERGGFADRLRYPAEDARYERPRLRAAGLLDN